MSYLFPYENLFVGVVVGLILGLLFVRVVVTRKQKAKDGARSDLG